jgi:hypothetical protein
MSGLHPTHRTRPPDAPFFDEICVLCGARDIAGGGWGMLEFECKGSDEQRFEYDQKLALFLLFVSLLELLNTHVKPRNFLFGDVTHTDPIIQYAEDG